MRYLIDGYNLMYAGGLLGKRLGPDGFRKVRTRFLTSLAAALGPIDAHQTTVVFDASAAPEDRPKETTHKGLTVVYAVDEANADERIEHLISGHSSPKALTVISSDNRIRQAARRRRARAVTADAFWVELDRRKERAGSKPVVPSPEADRPERLVSSEQEQEHWLSVFGDLDSAPETREALRGGRPLLTDEEIAEIERQLDLEPD